MSPSHHGASPDFGATFTRLLEAAALNPDKVLVRLGSDRGMVSRSTLYDWKKGKHLPEDTGPVMRVIRICLQAARDRGIHTVPSDEEGWLRLLPEVKQVRDSRLAEGRGAGGARHPSAPRGRPIGSWDPLALGVHRAIGGGPLPTYVPRPHDDLLIAALDPNRTANRLVVVRGGSSTGKSRAAYQAVRNQLPAWRLDYPRTPAALMERLEGGVARRTVLWLGELRDYAEAEGGTVALGRVAEMLAEDGQVVVLTTLWPEHWAAYTSTGHLTVVTRGLLGPLPELKSLEDVRPDRARGGVIDVPDRFTKTELARASQQGDATLQEAIAAAFAAGDDGEIIQYLAGAPDLLNRYQGPGAEPHGRAIITAAMDAARLGYLGPYAPRFLQAAATGYLTDRQRTAELSIWWDGALSYATEELKGAVQAIEAVPPQHGTGVAGYRLADYLDQHGRQTRRECLGAASLWEAMTHHLTSLGDLHRLANEAQARGLYRYAALLWTRAVTAGSTTAAPQLIRLLLAIHPDSACRASRWAADRADLSDPNGIVRLLHAISAAGAADAAVALGTQAAEHVSLDNPRDVGLLLKALHEVSATDGVDLVLARLAVHRPDLSDPRDVAWLLKVFRTVGAIDEAAALGSRAVGVVDLGSPWAVAEMLGLLRDVGAADAVAALAIRTARNADLCNSSEIATLLDAQHKSGATDGVAVLLARDPARHAQLGHPTAVSELLDALRSVGAADAVAALASRAAEGADLRNPVAAATLLGALCDVGATDAVAALAIRAAGDVDAGDPFAIVKLLNALRDVGATDAVRALATRAACDADLGSPFGVAGLLNALRDAGATDAVRALATRAACDADLGSPFGVAGLLNALREAGATDGVATLLARDPASHADLGDPSGVAGLLNALCQAGATDGVATLLARDPASHADLGNPSGVAGLLNALREAGATDGVATLLARDPASHADLGDPGSVNQLLRALIQAGATHTVGGLAARGLSNPDFSDPTAVTGALLALYNGGAIDAADTLARRTADRGLFDTAIYANPDWAITYTFGREPSDTPTARWEWNELNAESFRQV